MGADPRDLVELKAKARASGDWKKWKQSQKSFSKASGPRSVVVQIPMIERYRVFVARDRVVLVDPDTREVVDVVR